MVIRLLIFGLLAGFVESTCPSDEDGLLSFQTLYPNPTISTDVTITAATLFDFTNLNVNTIVISASGKLIMKPGSDISIRTRSIRIKDNGELIIGSENCRFTDNVDIALFGSRTIDRGTLTDHGEKFISVEDNGSLKIYGKEKPSWTKLTSTLGIPQPIYRHQADDTVNKFNTGYQGLAMTLFDATLTMTSYTVYDFWKGNSGSEQKQVDKMVTALNGISDGEVVAIEVQNYMKVSEGTDLAVLFSTIEALAGMDSGTLALRDSDVNDAFALVFQLGSSFDQCLDKQIGKPITTARASIEAYGKKISAVSTIKAGHKIGSSVDVLINSLEGGYPVLELAHDVENKWEIGDSVVIVSTDYSPDHAEVRNIKSFPTSSSIQLDHELMYRHFGEIEHDVDMRAEVGLLSRNIKIHGELSPGCPQENENCDKLTYDAYGCHIKILHSFAFVHIEGAELFHCGQPIDKGFYSIHFHMCLNVTTLEAVVKGNSIHDGFRAVTIHGTYGTSENALGVEVIDNVAYNILGHTFFMEDGSEKATLFRGNLALSVKKVKNGFFVTDADKPTAFWITSPETVLIDNVAGGSEGFGIWYTFPEVPVGPSKDLNIYEKNEASRTPLYTNDNNVAHSNDRGGLNFDNILKDEHGGVIGCMRYNPRVDPLDKNSAVSPVFIYRFTAYKNRDINLWLRGGGFYLQQCSLAESKRGVQLATGGPQHQYMSHCVIMGESEQNHEYIEGYPDAYGKGVKAFDHYLGVVFYDGPVWISDCFFTGFKSKSDGSIVAGALGFKPKNKFSSSILSTVTNLQFGGDDETEENRVFDGAMQEDGVNGFGNFDGDEVATFRDGDGSVVTCPSFTTSEPYQIYKPERFLQTDKTVYRPNWKMAWSTDLYGKISFDVQGDADGFDPYSQVKRVNRQDNNDLAYEDFDGLKNREYMTVLNRTENYYYQFQYVRGFPKKVKFVAKGVERGQDVLVAICLPEGTSKDDIFVKTGTPNDIYFDNSGSGIIWVDDLDTLVLDTTMSRLLIKDRFLYVHFASDLVRDHRWDKYDDNHCPGKFCPSLTLSLNNGAQTSYTPCFSATDQELNTDFVVGTVEECVMKKGTKEANWGAGDTLSSHNGGLTEWTSWTYCCNTDGASPVQTSRIRTCTFPIPHGPDADNTTCSGLKEKTKQCAISCPVNGEWSKWTRWTDCTCLPGTSGVKKRERTCDDTAYGGDYCKGSVGETNICKANCLMD